MEIRQGTRTPRRGVAPRRVAEPRVNHPPCVTADAGCTGAPVRALVPRKVWRDRGVLAGSTGCILRKAERIKNACVSFCDRLESC